jgi:hypothetical protein
MALLHKQMDRCQLIESSVLRDNSQDTEQAIMQGLHCPLRETVDHCKHTDFTRWFIL